MRSLRQAPLSASTRKIRGVLRLPRTLVGVLAVVVGCLSHEPPVVRLKANTATATSSSSVSSRSRRWISTEQASSLGGEITPKGVVNMHRQFDVLDRQVRHPLNESGSQSVRLQRPHGKLGSDYQQRFGAGETTARSSVGSVTAAVPPAPYKRTRGTTLDENVLHPISKDLVDPNSRYMNMFDDSPNRVLQTTVPTTNVMKITDPGNMAKLGAKLMALEPADVTNVSGHTATIQELGVDYNDRAGVTTKYRGAVDTSFAPSSTWYHIKVKGSSHFLWEDAKIDTSVRGSNDGSSLTMFSFEKRPDGFYNIKAEASNNWLREDGYVVKGSDLKDDDGAHFEMLANSDWTYHIRVKKSGRYLREDALDSVIRSHLLKDNYTKMILEVVDEQNTCESFDFESACPAERCSWSIHTACTTPEYVQGDREEFHERRTGERSAAAAATGVVGRALAPLLAAAAAGAASRRPPAGHIAR